VTAVFAHRGSTDGCRENTLEAFAQAGRLGADGVELDVRLTADGALAIHHDAEVEDLGPLAFLESARLPAYVPRLAESLATCTGMVVNVEIKNSPADPGHDATEKVAALTAAAIADAGWTERVIVSSFQVSTLKAVRAADDGLPIGLLCPIAADPRAALDLAVGEGWQAIHPFVTEVSAPLVEAAHAAGLAVNVWTVNAAHDLIAFVELGVDAVITDRLAEAVAIARGERA